MKKSPIEILAQCTSLSVAYLEFGLDVQMVRPCEATQAIEDYHAQFEGECEWKCLKEAFYTYKPQCFKSEVIIRHFPIPDEQIYCPYCGRKIKKVPHGGGK